MLILILNIFLMMLILQASVESRYSELQDLTNQRRAKLTDSRKLFELYREAEEVSIWITDKGVIAASEDYGQDLEHVQVGEPV